MPNGETMVATNTALLPFPQLPLADQNCNVFLALQQTLLSLGQFCDAGLKATLTSETFLLTKDCNTTLAGKRDHRNGLYFILLQGYPNSNPPPHTYTFPTIHGITHQCSPHTSPILCLNQQHVPHKHTARSCTVPTQGLCQPGCAHLVQGHRCRVFHHLARPHLQVSSQAPPRVH